GGRRDSREHSELRAGRPPGGHRCRCRSPPRCLLPHQVPFRLVASDLFQTLLSNLWILILVVFFFGGSIFVHELGHFLAARRRGAVVERFSIGFGPAIWSRRGKDGVEYRLSWIPLGGYVLLPQLADLGAVEGESTTDVKKLP